MTYLPFCKKIALRPAITVTRNGYTPYTTQPIYEWCQQVYCEGGKCGPEGKLYMKAPGGLNIKPIVPIISDGKLREGYKAFNYSIDEQ
jgi:hypothetical protein